MAKTWQEVESSPLFSSLNPDEREEAREQYFAQVVAPFVPANDAPRARIQFDRDTKRESFGDSMGKVVDNAGYDLGMAAGGLTRGIGEHAFSKLPTDVQQSVGRNELLERVAEGKRVPAEAMGIDLQSLSTDPMEGPQDPLDAIKRNTTAQKMQVEAGRAVTPLAKKGTEIYKHFEEERANNPYYVDPDSVQRYVAEGTEALLGSVLPTLGIAVATRSPNLALTAMGGQVFGHKYGEERTRGVDPANAAGTALFYAASESLTERIPLEAALKPGATVLKRLATTMGLEGGQEMLTQVLQSAYDMQVLDRHMPLDQALRQVVDAGIVGAFIGGGMALSSPQTYQRQPNPAPPVIHESLDLQNIRLNQDAATPSPYEQDLKYNNRLPFGGLEPGPEFSGERHAINEQGQPVVVSPFGPQAAVQAPIGGLTAAAAKLPAAPEPEIIAAQPEPVIEPIEPTALAGAGMESDRRKDGATRKRIDEMSPEEMRQELLVSKTGIPSRRAYDDTPRKPVQASIDLDGMKGVNDTMGHSKGDEYLTAFAKQMQEAGVTGYHFSGDEFAAEADTTEELDAKMDDLRSRLKDSVVSWTSPDGTVYEKRGIEFSYGKGNTYEEADHALKQDKAERAKQGLRTERGGNPERLVEATPEGGEGGLQVPAVETEAAADKEKDKYARIAAKHESARAALKNFKVGQEVEFTRKGPFTNKDGTVDQERITRDVIEKISDKDQGSVKVGNYFVYADDLRPVSAKQPETPDARILHTFVNAEEGTEARVAKNDKGFYVSLKDKDSGETLPSGKIFPDVESAIAHAKDLVKAKKDAPKQHLDAMFDEVLAEETKQPEKQPTADTAKKTAQPTASNPADTLRAAGMSVRKTATKNGKEVWEVSGKTKDHMHHMKAMGGRWYGPKRVWSFYDADPSADIARRLGGISASAVSTDGTQSTPDAPETSDLGAMFDEMLAEETAAPAPKPQPRAAATPTVTAKVQSAGKSVTAGLDESLKALGALFGGNGKLSSGLSFDEETYAKAKPHFEAAISHFKDAATDVKEAMRMVVRKLMEMFNNPQMVQNMKPYVVRFIEDVQSGKIGAPDTGESANVDSRTDEQGAQTLEGVPSGQDRGTETTGSGGAGSVSARGGDHGAAGNNQPDAAGVAGTRGGGSGAPAVHSPETGARSGSRGLGSRRTRRNGGTVPGHDEGAAAGELAPAAIPGANFVITEDVRLGKGGETEKFNDNISAIKTLKLIERESRRATPEEQRTLARYVGWGGLANAFKNRVTAEVKSGWEDRVKELESLLTDEELNTARGSTRNAHYTSETVVRGIWDAVEHLGFTGGMVLEPSSGVGNFIGMMPDSVRGQSKVIAIEYDGISARIAKALYPQSTVLQSGFQNVPLPDVAFDLAIGNPPFGNEKLYFQHKPELNQSSIHNQFFLASLDALRPGGIQAMVVSRYLLDAKDPADRIALATKAELLGAIRLPDTAFKENARTEVVTDILFLQKRDTKSQEEMEAAFSALNGSGKNADKLPKVWNWVETGTIKDPLGGEPITVNNFYIKNPQMMIGSLERSGKMSHKEDVTLRLPKDADFEQMLDDAILTLPKGVAVKPDDVIKQSLARYDSMVESLEISISGSENGAISVNADGKLEQVIERETPEGGVELKKRVLTPDSPWSVQLLQDQSGKWFRMVEKLDESGNKVKQGRGIVYEREVFNNESDIPGRLRLGKDSLAKLTDMVKLRDLLKQQIVLETKNSSAEKIEGNRKELAAAYKAFTGAYGFVSNSKNATLIADMPDGALIMALEMSYKPEITKARADRTGDKPRAESATPAPILKERVIIPYTPPEKADSAADALKISMSESGGIDIDRIAHLLGTSADDAIDQLHTKLDKPMAFFDPETNRWTPRDEYLTGLVKRKLNAAREAVLHTTDRNVGDLQKNIAALEGVQPESIGAENITVHIGANWVPPAIYRDFIHSLIGGDGHVNYSKTTNSFDVNGFDKANRVKNTDEFGTKDYPANKLIHSMLNSREIKVVREDSEGKKYTDKEASALAQFKAKLIANEFINWIFNDAARRKTLTEIFNDRYNNLVKRQHDGSHLTLPGKVPDSIIRMRRHQKNAIWRGISERFMLLDHVVGAGKTFTAIARAMERRRMGLSKKPMVAVPNHLVDQWAADAYRLYPGARILAATKKDFEKKHRRRLFAKIATGDWDLVIVPHSSFGFIDIAPETQYRFLEQELKTAKAAIDDAWEQAQEDDTDNGWRKPFNVKEAERLAESIQSRIEKLKDRKRDRLLTFEQLGVDDMTVDEAHEFKNLFYSSRLTGVRGMGNKQGSNKALDLYNKVRILRESPTGSVVFMTGTPISNSAVEMYTLMRYLAADQLDELGMSHFDGWRSQFVDVGSKFEPNEAGTLVQVNRLGRSWSNMRSLMDLYYTFTDPVSLSDIQQAYKEDNGGIEFPVPKVKGGDRRRVIIKPTPEQTQILQDVLAGFAGLDAITDYNERNKQRLKLMDRARKVSLAARVVNPRIVDSAGGKLDVVADEAAAIYKKWNGDKGTQMIFLDRSVPKAKGDDKIIKEYDKLMTAREKALLNNDEEAYRAVNDKLEPFDPDEMVALRAAQTGGWTAYQQIKDNLISRGIPENEIRFIQEASNDAQKKALFDAVNAGEVRILLGSTQRMGAGTNAQERLVALHHVDINWKPSDIEQREGRIIRQGNRLLEKYGKDFEVEIIAYATERTIDAKMWDLNATKLKTINGIRKYTGDFNLEMEDADSVSMAEIAALASGDPMLLERVQVEAEIEKLHMLERAFRNRKFQLDDDLKQAKETLETTPKKIENRRARMALFNERRTALLSEPKPSVNIEGKDYSDHFEANRAAEEAIKAQTNAQEGDEKQKKYSITVNGERFSAKDKIADAIGRSLGDEQIFRLVADGKTYNRRADLVRDIVAKVDPVVAENGSIDSLTLGKLYGMPLVLDVDVKQGKLAKDVSITLSLLDEQGSTITSEESLTNTSQGIRAILSSIVSYADAAGGDPAKDYTITSMEQRLKRAGDELPELEKSVKEDFPHAAELTKKKARLEEVISILAGKGKGKQPDSTHPEDEIDSPKMSLGKKKDAALTVAEVRRAIAPLTKTWGGPDGGVKIVQSIEELPIRLVEYIMKNNAQDESGGVFDPETEHVYLVANNLGSAKDAILTAIHEKAGHFGLRKIIPKGQIIPLLNSLYSARQQEADEIAKQYGFDTGTTNGRLSAAEELLANTAEKGDQSNFVDRVVSMLRQLLRRINPNLKVTDKELRGLIGRQFRATKIAAKGGNTPESPMLSSRRKDWNTGDADLDSALNKIHFTDKRTLIDRIKDVGASLRETITKEFADNARQGVFDSFYGLKRAEGETTYNESAYVAARMTTSLPAQMHVVLEKGPLKWVNNTATIDKGGKGLMHILKPVSDNLDLWLGYMAGRRALRLHTEGREKLLSVAEANALARLEEQHPEFKKAAGEWAEFNRKMLDFAQDAGVIDPVSRRAWEHSDYIPFYRIMDESGFTKGPRGKRGIQGQHSGIKKLKGGDSDLNDILENMLMNTAHLIGASMKNHAMRLAVENLKSTDFISKAPSQFKPAIIPLSEVKAYMKQIQPWAFGHGIDLDNLPDSIWRGFERMWSVNKPEGKDVVSVLIDGKREYYHVHDPLLLRSLTSINKADFGKWMEVFRSPKRLLTQLVTADPGFMLRNFTRDTLQAYVISRDKMKPIIPGVTELVKSFKDDDELMQIWAAGGGFHGGYINAHDPKALNREVRSLVHKHGLAGTVISSPQRLWDAWLDFGSKFENANRVAAHKAAHKAGKSRLGAAFEAKDFMDFSMRGDFAVVQFLSETVPFLNARAQGLYRLSIGAAEQKRAFLIKGSMIMLASVALFLMYADDDRYKELEDWDKNTYYHFWLGDEHFRIPKPFEVGAIFGTIPERITEAFYAEQDEPGKKLLKQFGWVLGEMFNFGSVHIGGVPAPIPQTMVPPLQLWANVESFTGRPILDMADQGQLPETQYDNWTSDTAIELGKATGLSPKQIEFLVRGYLGTLGGYALGTTDIVTRQINDAPKRPAKRLEEMPIIKSFYQGSQGAKRTRYATEMYDLMREVDAVYRSVNALASEGKKEDAIALRDKHKDKLKYRKLLDSSAQKLTEVRKAINAISSSDASPEVKREKIDQLIAKRNAFVEKVVQTIEADQ